MTTKEFKEQLITGQEQIIEAYQQAFDESPKELKRLMTEILRINKTVLRRIQSTVKSSNVSSKKPPSDMFKKKEQPTVKELKDSKVKNDNINKGVFGKEDSKGVPKPEKLKNENINKGAFDKEDVPEIGKITEKASPERLNKTQMSDIKKLAEEGFTAVQISDELMIVQSKVDRVLSKSDKNGKTLLATSNDNGQSNLEKKIKNSQDAEG